MKNPVNQSDIEVIMCKFAKELGIPNTEVYEKVLDFKVKNPKMFKYQFDEERKDWVYDTTEIDGRISSVIDKTSEEYKANV